MRTITLFLFLMLTKNVVSQNLKIEFGAQANSCSFSQIKSLQSFRQKNLQVPAKLVYDFPMTIGYNASIWFPYKEKINWGFNFFFSSTGSRLSYGDYSGKMNLDIVSSSFSFGPIGSISAVKKNNIECYLIAAMPISVSKLKFHDQISINNITSVESNIFYSSSLGFLFGIKPEYKFHFISLSANCFYLFDFGGLVKPKLDSKDYIVDQNGSKLFTNISGIRLGLNLGINF